jgi:hypothetical protein
MEQQIVPCIYCGKDFDPRKGAGDHVLPVGLFGEFENDLAFRGICTACNNGFSILDQLLIQGSPLGFYRQLAQPNRGKRSCRGGGVPKGSSGAAKPKYTVDVGDWSLEVIPSANDPENVDVFDQVVVRLADGEQRHVMIYEGMNSSSFAKKLKDLLTFQVAEVGVFCELRSFAFVEEVLVRPSFASVPITKIDPFPADTSGARINGEYRFNVKYFQALSKIAFHYYLTRNRRGYTGAEPIFSSIRDFIKFGGAEEVFFRKPVRAFFAPFGRTKRGTYLCPKDWCHVLAADETEGDIVVHLQLYIGPGYVPEPVYVTVGHSSIVAPRCAWGNLFKVESRERGRYAGRVYEMNLIAVK